VLVSSSSTGEFYYLESNCRLQVEHPVTEQVWDIDLVALMLQQAEAELSSEGALSTEYLDSLQASTPPSSSSAHAIEVRLYAEDPIKDFRPSPGLLQQVAWPSSGDHTSIRLDSWIKSGTQVSPSYDPLLSKIIAFGKSREAARTALHAFLSEARILGTPNNLQFLADVIEAPAFKEGHTLTSFLRTSFTFKPNAIEIITPGLSTSIQDLGRQGVGFGVPESGAMDTLHMKLANALVGNALDVETLEIVLIGPEVSATSTRTQHRCR
jgi:urea carboxylase